MENSNKLVINKYGYIQKGNRYFWRINDTVEKTQGFKSKKECDKWIDDYQSVNGLDYRVGYMVKFKSDETPRFLVDKNNVEIKY